MKKNYLILTILTFLLSIVISNKAWSQAPWNDECANALPLNVSTTCNYSNYTNVSATASASIPAPGCANYSTGDVWFSFIVPSNGQVAIDMTQGTMTDSGMAWYSGSCGALTLIECDDDDSPNGLMSYISRTGLTPGAKIYVRIWGYGGTFGTFGICATSAAGCVNGGGTGTSSAGCPSVLSGGLGLSGADPAAIPCTANSTCVDLEADYLVLGETTSYSVESITYAPPYQFDCLTNAVSVNTDDLWSPPIDLPFNFCFYGNTYNKCLIGSNGVITFDLASNTAGGYCGYSFAANLPIAGDASLVENAIFGVFHDIDPSLGGEVGWELITLNTGCRALVASWSNVPMFSCTSVLYSGMIVLYENTNVIEVYIKEKNVCATWNGGNAVVGVQNATGTVATVAPNRNGLDADWTVTNEAWRFVPSGTSITSIKWYEGSGVTGPVVGTTDQITVCPTSTTTYTAEISYQLCNGSTIKEVDETTVTIQADKVWNGSVNTDWNNANNWTPTGIPNALDCVVIPNTANDPLINTSAGYNGLGLNLYVHDNAKLSVGSDNNLTITDLITVDPLGDLEVQNNSNLVQINNITNVGNINMIRDANIRLHDYVFWSSPVANFPVWSIPGTDRYKWIPTIQSFYASNYGNWSYANENMVKGKGYIVKSPANYTNTIQTLTNTFNGNPNNGDISIPVSRSTYDGANYIGPTATPITKDEDNWNLIGNPYPSAINAINFLTANSNIAGFIKVWTHGTPLGTSAPTAYYQNYQYNYSLNDYITYNVSGSSMGPSTYNGYIAAGQGFFVLMNHTSASTTENVVFNNTMRSHTYSNNQFFKGDLPSTDNEEIERNRIWLDLSDSNNNSVRALVGYISGATNELDRLYDATAPDKNLLDIHSIVDDVKLTIQGKALPFNNEDQIPLGVYIPSSGNYSIGIGALDGLFSNPDQAIYLEDLETGVIYNLRLSPYNFTANTGNIDNRFVLRFTQTALNTQEYTTDQNNILVLTDDHLTIKSLHLNDEMDHIILFDVLGKTLTKKNQITASEVIFTDLLKNNNAIIVQVTMKSGAVIHKKIIF